MYINLFNIIEVDDGSESIECLIFKNDIKENEITNYTKYQIFDTLCIEGKIHEYKNIKNLHIIKISKFILLLIIMIVIIMIVLVVIVVIWVIY